MNALFRVTDVTPNLTGRSVIIDFENGGNINHSTVENQCCDIRIGDIVSKNPETQRLIVHLDLRPPEAVPYQA